MESFEARLKRFTDSSEHEIPLTILNSVTNFFLPEIQVAKEKSLDRLIFLGIHATIQTVSEKIFGKRGLEGTRFYLKHFVDGSTQDRQFSLISDDIHEMRNVVAHQWLSSRTHDIAINYAMPEGWKLDPNLLHINPDIYAEQFLASFGRGGPIWTYRQLVSDQELTIRKYQFIKDWLHLNKQSAIAQAIKTLETCTTTQDILNQETLIKQLIYKQYSFT